MRAEQCVSVTELAKNTSSIIKRTPKIGVQYVFVNNKPEAVILSMQEYENIEQSKRVDF
jgi:prevent-host-death family protein